MSTLINDSKLPLNNLTLKTERGLARRVPVRVLNGPLGCLEYKECIRISKQYSFPLRVIAPLPNNLYVLQNLELKMRLIFKTLRLEMMG